MAERAGGYRIGIDVGGTFTDFVLADPATGAIHTFKEPSTPHDPSEAVERGIRAMLEQHAVAAGSIDAIVHGTTLGLNAILQRRGAATVLVVSRGNRDVLELARCRMPSPYDFSLPRDEPLLPRDRVFEVNARCDASGEIIARPQASELDAVAERIRATEAHAAAVTLLNAYLTPSLEDEVAAALRERLPGVHITASTRVWPEMREYERAMLAVMNAYVHPMLDAYYERLEQRLRAIGIDADLYLTASNGGTLSVASARDRPVDTLLSGPASGVVAGCQLAARLGLDGMVSIDMGGTSCDMAVAEGGAPRLTTRAHVGEFPVIAPVVDVSAIGAGGGSVVWVDSQGVLKVGPRSAGADPGPVCYGRGGTEPTVTDCFLVTGLVDADAFLGGRMHLDRAAAERVLAELGRRIGFDGEDAAVRAADAAIRVATAMMGTALYKELAQRGVDPRGLALVAFGGAGPTQASLLADEARLDRIVVPLAPGTFCAYGAMQSEVRRDYVRSLRVRLTAAPAIDAVRASLAEMEAEALAWVSSEGARLAAPVITRSADMRYAGQAYDLAVPLTDADVEADAAALAERFHAEHARVYGFPDRESEVEVMTVRLSVSRALPPVEPATLAPGAGTPQSLGTRALHVRERGVEATVYHRDALHPGHRLTGPAIVEQSDTTVLVLPGWDGTVHAEGALVLTRKRGA
ncbi:MAG: hydantoinase/oxoprolinase family protein [Ectothiorhodospiraceae bacterium]|nr:hydantoinase/oxoprolinase family protein [Chromatiales bacterium]MCP5154077.1 hydantoinase/oxoprolinase family protein [Ectothiorhodospiraceae bacterium]